MIFHYNLSITILVNSVVERFPPISIVLLFCFNKVILAFSILAASVNNNKYSNFSPIHSGIIFVNKKYWIEGLAIFFYCEYKSTPCTGSNNRKIFTYIQLKGPIPNPPTTCAACIQKRISPKDWWSQ